MQLVPGGPADQMIQRVRGSMTSAGEGSTSLSGESAISEKEIALIKKHFGFDKPILIRYFVWLKKIFVLDLGQSYSYHQSVLSLILNRLPVSLTFGLFSFFLTYLICVPLGMLKAVFNHSFF